MTTWVRAPEDLVADLEPAGAGRGELHRQLAAALESGEAVLELGGRRWRAGPALLRFIDDSLATADAGRKVGYVAEDELMSPGQAGELLGVSRPFVYKLMERGEIPVAQAVGSHSKLAARDVLAWRERQLRRAGAAADAAARAESLAAGGGPPKSGRALTREVLAAVRSGDADALDAAQREAKAARAAAALARQADATADDEIAPAPPVPPAPAQGRPPRGKSAAKLKLKQTPKFKGGARLAKTVASGRLPAREAVKAVRLRRAAAAQGDASHVAGRGRSAAPPPDPALRRS